MLIGLVAVLGFAGVWFAALRPKDTVGTNAPAVKAAQGAVAISQQSAAAAEAAAGQTPAGQAPAPTAAQPAAPAGRTAPARVAPAVKTAAGDPSAPILRELAHGKTAVLLFWHSRGADDNAARDAVRAANRHGGRVTVHVASIDRVADYAAITSGVDVLQSPTVLVIGPDHKARTIVGYTDPREVDQLVDDVRRGG
jgi:hypothetical protein